MRRRRAEGSVEIRKQKKEEQLMKRRNIDVQETEPDDAHDSTGKPQDQQSPLSVGMAQKSPAKIFWGDSPPPPLAAPLLVYGSARISG